jgi:hypothetical protein
MRKLYLMLIPAACILASCSKAVNTPGTTETDKKAAEFAAALKSNKYKLVSFTSDKPIDYIANDNETKSETDLWAYVKEYVKDDVNQFNANSTVSIWQGAMRVAGKDGDVISVAFGAQGKDDAVMLNFVDYDYEPMQYKLDKYDAAQFTVYIDGPSGSKLYSKFAKVN